MDVLLVNSRLKEVTQHACLSLPLGLAYIGAVLQGAGYDVSAIDLNVTPVDDAQITRLIERASPSILAISTNTPTYLSGLTFARRAKEVNPGIKVVVGGPHASVLYREVAMEKEVDVVARSEGEYTMLELADCLIRNRGELADIKGVAYKDNGAIRVTGKRAPITDPDQLPFPARHLFPFGLYDIPNAVLASRGGCPFGCYFCAVNNIWEGKIRHRNPRKVIEEIFSVVNTFGIRQAGKVSFSDDVFTLDRKKALDICHLISQSMDSNPLPWRCTTRVDLVDAELIKEMSQAGCRQVQYGVEAGSQKILDSIGKKITLEQVRRMVELTIKCGMDAACSFMFPHPEDTEQTVREQIGFMKELSQMGASEILAITTPLPGTYLYENADRLGVRILSTDWNDYDCWHYIMETRHLSREKIEALHQELVQSVGMIESD